MSLFKEFWRKIQDLLGIIPSKIREYASHSLQVTTLIKQLLDNPVADAITEITPFTWDEKLKAAVLQALSKALPYLVIVDSCKEHTELEDMLKCWMAELAKQPKDVRNAMLHKLASLLTAILDNKERKQNEYDYYLQLLYSSAKELKP